VRLVPLTARRSTSNEGSQSRVQGMAGTLLRFPAADGTQLDGVLVGSGPAGVVLLHQYPADLCGFWPYAVYLSKRGPGATRTSPSPRSRRCIEWPR
jgi:hypothetical protein